MQKPVRLRLYLAIEQQVAQDYTYFATAKHLPGSANMIEFAVTTINNIDLTRFCAAGPTTGNDA